MLVLKFDIRIILKAFPQGSYKNNSFFGANIDSEYVYILLKLS